ncbi:hypothetical protein ACFFOM_04105 [Microlunatus capsulatus]|uniref:Uncharacterized protein n=1 Tax=Microlunatus capsulatus TaxID=99117 RepID=A0ABS4Z210_9ACTN|nr:hypothetical protein [Microlunatus capsulatus]MBP2415083.1 hypothetical protein [Microlunatus capsulatus]
MSEPLDEDAPALAAVAADATTLLEASTDDGVGHPGLEGLGDAEDVVTQLSRLAEELQRTMTHLGDYLDESSSGRDHPRPGLGAARQALGDVRVVAAEMAQLLRVAEQALLEARTAR